MSKLENARNLLITFLASGLWHGANWTFVIWGGIHGVLQILEDVISLGLREKNPGYKILRRLIVLALVTFAWIFFVSNSVDDAFYVISHMGAGIASPVSYVIKGLVEIGFDRDSLILICGSIFLLAIYDYVSLTKDVIECIGKYNVLVRWSIYVLFVLVLVFFSQKGVAKEFVYFQF